MMKNLLLTLVVIGQSILISAQAPQYVYNKVLGGNMTEIVVGSDGYLYVCGTWTGLRDFDPGADTYNMTSSYSGAMPAAYMGKYTAAGDLIWVKGIVSSNNGIDIQAIDLTLDADNNLLLLIGTNDMSLDADASVEGVDQPLLGANTSYGGIATKYDNYGNMVWASPIERDSYDSVNLEDIVTDGERVFVTGVAPAEYYGGWIWYGDGVDCGCYLFTPTGFSAEDMGFTVVWDAETGDALPTNLGFASSYGKRAPKITFDELGYRYVLSYSSYFENSSVSLIKYEPNSSLQSWMRNNVIVPNYYIENITLIEIENIAVDNDHNIYIAGSFGIAQGFTMNFNTDPITSFSTTSMFDTDAFVFKTDPLGYGEEVVKLTNGADYDQIYAFELNKNTGVLYIAGTMRGTIDFDPDAGVVNLTGDAQGDDYYLARYDSNLNYEFAGKYDGISSVHVVPLGLSFNANNELLVSGRIDNGPIDVDFSADVNNAMAASSSYGIIVNYASCSASPLEPQAIIGSSSVCMGNEYEYSIPEVVEATSYTWTLPNGWTGTSSDNTIMVSPGENAGDIMVTANNACGVSTAQSIAISTYAPVVNASATDDEICNGESTTLSATGALSYSWTNGASSGVPISPSETSTYTVTGTDEDGCAATAEVTITVLAAPDVNAQATDEEICSSDFTILSAMGAISYSWNNGALPGVPFSPSATTTYTVTGADINGCTASDEITIVVHSLNDLLANATATILCEGTELTLFGTGAEEYSWSQGVVNGVAFTPSSTATYILTGTDAFGCTGNDAITVEVAEQPEVNAEATTTTVCMGSSVTLSGSGADIYNWNNGVQNGVPFSPIVTNTYTVVGVDENNCSDTDQITIEVVGNPTVNANASVDEICSGSQVVLFGSGATTYTWTGGVFDNVAFAPTATATYTVTGTDGNGCTDTDNVEVIVNQLPIILFTPSDDTLCTIDPPLVLNATPAGGTYSGTGVSGNLFNPAGLAPGTYNITYIYTDDDGCTATKTVEVVVEICGLTHELDALYHLRIYPNPANDVMNAMWHTDAETLTLTDAAGRIVKTEQVKGLRQLQINLQSLAAGCYMVQIHTSNGLVTQVVVVK